ncbi:hypothetical protein [Actinomadura napierensis]|uniref:PKD domain-containing protein n=1 Tax=Actinomadura napierensis TaxID=267854 RepID=A0ABP5M9Z7_9ACTN
MSPRSSRRRHLVLGGLVSTALVTPLLAASPAQAAPCRLGSNRHASCNKTIHEPGGGGSGGPSGGGGGPSGPVEPPAPVGLDPNQGVGVAPVPGGNAAPPAAAPATADLVAQAQASAVFPVPVVHTAPKGKTFVRLRTSLWVDGFDTVRTNPITVGAQTIQLTGAPATVTWNLGEATKTCKDAGSENGRTCDYIYQRSSAGQPGGAYQVTATITWDVTWTCGGDDCDEPGGNLGPNAVTSQASPLVVGEIQTTTGQ